MRTTIFRDWTLLFLLAGPLFASEGSLELSVQPATPVVGEPLHIALDVGSPGQPTMLFAGPGGASPSILVAGGLTGPQGSFTYSTTPGPELAGLSFALQGYALLGNDLCTSEILEFSVENPGGPEARIYLPPDPMKIAPYTALFSGIESASPGSEIVKWDWDFGDSNSPGESPTAEGMLVSHRFDHPGTYSIRLTVQDDIGQTHTSTLDISIHPFSGETYYLSQTGDDSQDGLSPATAWRSLEHAFDQMGGSHLNPNRLLLRAGDQWTLDHSISPPKPSLLGSHGPGPRPVIEFLDVDEGLDIIRPQGDWGYGVRLEDLHIRHPEPRVSYGIVNANASGTLLRNCIIENGAVKRAYPAPTELLVIEDCELSGSRRQGIFSNRGTDILIRRSTVRAAGTDDIYDHCIYLGKVKRILIEDILLDGEDGELNLALKSRTCEDVVVRGCEARNTRNGFGSGSHRTETQSKNVLFENCISHHNGANRQAAAFLIGDTDGCTIRNCEIYFNHPQPQTGQGAIWITGGEKPGIRPRVRLYNNTFFGNQLRDIYLTAEKFDLIARNNIFVKEAGDGVPSLTSFLYVEQADLVDLDSDYNLFFWAGKSAEDPTFSLDQGPVNLSFLEWQALGQDSHSQFLPPQFLDSLLLDFRLDASSPALDAGIHLPEVPADKNGISRPQGGSHDQGAHERP